MASNEAIKKKQQRTNKFRSQNREAYNEYIREYRKDKTAGRQPKPLGHFVKKHGGDTSPQAKRQRIIKGKLTGMGMGIIDPVIEVLESARANPLPLQKTKIRTVADQSRVNRTFVVEEREGLFRVVLAPPGMPVGEKIGFNDAVAEADRLNRQRNK